MTHRVSDVTSQDRRGRLLVSAVNGFLLHQRKLKVKGVESLPQGTKIIMELSDA
jgi:hypothetical protein